MANKIFDASRMGILCDFQPSYPELFIRFMHFTIEKKLTQDGYFLDCNYYDEISFLAVKKIPINLLDREKGILEFIKKAIDLGYYILLPVDTKFITPYLNYGKEHYIHHLFIYGYNQKQVLCGDFFHYSDGKFSVQKVSFTEIVEAYKGVQKYLEDTSDPMDYSDEWKRDIELLRLMKNQKIKFSLDNLITNITYFLNSCDSSGNKGIKEKMFYGMESYDLIIKYLKDLDSFSDKTIDTRILTLLYYRYIFMEKQCRYVEKELVRNECDFLIFYKGYEEMQKLAKGMLLLAMKYNIALRNGVKLKVQNTLKNLQEKDQKLMKGYLEKLIQIKNGTCG